MMPFGISFWDKKENCLGCDVTGFQDAKVYSSCNTSSLEQIKLVLI